MAENLSVSQGNDAASGAAEKHKTIGVIGVGNMGGALIKGMISNGAATPGNVLACDVDREKLAAFCQATGARETFDNAALAREADTIVLAVKPARAEEVLSGVASVLTKDKLLISVVLGLELKKISDVCGGLARLVRCMPNTPALVNSGVTCVAMGKNTSISDREYVEVLFNAVGTTEFMTEADVSRVTALTGSSPAYVFMMIDAMADAAVLLGLSRDVSLRLASRAVMGSANMVLKSGKHPAELKDRVCSPAGSTIEAVRVLEEKGFRGTLIDAMIACGNWKPSS